MPSIEKFKEKLRKSSEENIIAFKKFVLIPLEVNEFEKLGFLQIGILYWIIKELQKSNVCTFSNNDFAKLFGCTKITVSRTIQILKEDNYINVHRSGKIRYLESNYSFKMITKEDHSWLLSNQSIKSNRPKKAVKQSIRKYRGGKVAARRG
jgi:DNA-binding MarR family transcriptional regulator